MSVNAVLHWEPFPSQGLPQEKSAFLANINSGLVAFNLLINLKDSRRAHSSGRYYNRNAHSPTARPEERDEQAYMSS